MERYGLVLAGGGGKGAYQIGAWRALKEMEIAFDAIAGVSIGSINGELIDSDEYDKAVEMWNSVSVDKGVRISENLPDPENLFSKKNWSTLFRELVKNKGIDASPAKEFISQYIDEDKVRKSYIDFCMIAVQMSNGMTPRELSIRDIPEGQLIDYLMASSNVPFMTNIGPEGEKFLDGGAYDNIPVATLKKRGYNRLVIIDISNIKGVAHNLDIFNSQIVYVRPYDLDDLGASFDFDKETIEKRLQLGYLDTKKAFSQLLGKIYYFLPETFRSMVRLYGADTVLKLEKMAHELKVPQTEIYTAETFILAVKQAYEKFISESNESSDESEDAKNESNVTAENEKDKESGSEKSLIAALKKRFEKKKPFEEYEDTIEFLENYAI